MTDEGKADTEVLEWRVSECGTTTVELDLIEQVLHLLLGTGCTDEFVEGVHQFLGRGIGASLIASDIHQCQSAKVVGRTLAFLHLRSEARTLTLLGLLEDIDHGAGIAKRMRIALIIDRLEESRDTSLGSLIERHIVFLQQVAEDLLKGFGLVIIELDGAEATLQT